jgi:glycine/D-amino acid oxidase-like deaminating enzyme
MAPDSLPIIGRAPAYDNVYLATGGGKKGILLSPAIGKAIADLISQGRTPLPIETSTPERFLEAPNQSIQGIRAV